MSSTQKLAVIFIVILTFIPELMSIAYSCDEDSTLLSYGWASKLKLLLSKSLVLA